MVRHLRPGCLREAMGCGTWRIMTYDSLKRIYGRINSHDAWIHNCRQYTRSYVTQADPSYLQAALTILHMHMYAKSSRVLWGYRRAKMATMPGKQSVHTNMSVSLTGALRLWDLSSGFRFAFSIDHDSCEL